MWLILSALVCLIHPIRVLFSHQHKTDSNLSNSIKLYIKPLTTC